ncbi:MAG: T9SS type A sorting domain-containing protein, partial [Bacteroidia bacterium]
VTLIVSNSCGSDTITQSLTVVGIEGALSGTIELSPVPARDQVRISLADLTSDDMTITMVDLQGRTLKVWTPEVNGGSAASTLDVSSFARGVYYLQFSSQGRSTTKKLILE